MNSKRFALGESCHLLSQHFLSLLKWSWHSTEILNGKYLCRNFRRDLASLKSPCATFFTSSSAFSLGAKSECPGTQ